MAETQCGDAPRIGFDERLRFLSAATNSREGFRPRPNARGIPKDDGSALLRTGTATLQPATWVHYARLHLIVFAWGFTGILGRAIDLPSTELVMGRCAIAAATLWVWIKWRPNTRAFSADSSATLSAPESVNAFPSARVIGSWWSIGTLLGLHWILFFAAIRVGNVSIAMVGLATQSICTAVLEPLLIRDRKLRWDHVVFGLTTLAAIAYVYRTQTTSIAWGFALAVLAAVLSALFSIANVRYTHDHDARRIAMHQLMSATVLCGFAWGIARAWQTSTLPIAVPSVGQWLGMFALGTICTAYAYVEFIALLRRMTVFTILFANNLEPVYGVVLGSLLFSDHRELTADFYIGAAVILVSVAGQTLITANRRRRSTTSVAPG